MAQQGSVYSLTTPAVLIDENIIDKNIARVQKYMDEAGLKARPHIKTHKIPEFAKKQLAAGAVGITCQKISEAQVFADAGINDILLTFNIIGEEKLEALKALHNQITLSVVADSKQTVDGLAKTFDADRPLRVMVECDTGGQRCGVQTPREATELAQYITAQPSLKFVG